MDALDGGGDIECCRPCWVGPGGLGCRHDHQAPGTLSAIEHAMAHGIPEPLQGRVWLGRTCMAAGTQGIRQPPLEP